MDLLKGDKLVCKVSILDWFDVDKEYEVVDYSNFDNNIIVRNNIDEHIYFSQKYYEFKYLWDYFYTKQELRKLKLNRVEKG